MHANEMMNKTTIASEAIEIATNCQVSMPEDTLGYFWTSCPPCGPVFGTDRTTSLVVAEAAVVVVLHPGG